MTLSNTFADTAYPTSISNHTELLLLIEGKKLESVDVTEGGNVCRCHQKPIDDHKTSANVNCSSSADTDDVEQPSAKA